MDEPNEGQPPPNIPDDSDQEVTDDEEPSSESMVQKEPVGRQRAPRGVDKVIDFMKVKHQHKNSRPAPDDIDMFFGSAALSVKKLPRLLQNRIKRQVLDAISQAEEENELSMPRFVPPRAQYLVASPSVSPSPSDTSTTSASPVFNQTPKHRDQQQFPPLSPAQSTSRSSSLPIIPGRNSIQTTPGRFNVINKPSSLSETGTLLRETANSPDFYSDHFEDNYSDNSQREYY